MPKEFLGAFKRGHRPGIREYIDDDQFSFQLLRKAQGGCKESLEALQWITKYNNETYRGVLKKNNPSAIHNTPKLYKEATDAHNARRRDLTSVIKSGAVGTSELLPYSSQIMDRNMNFFHEDTLLDLLSPNVQGYLSRLAPKKKK